MDSHQATEDHNRPVAQPGQQRYGLLQRVFRILSSPQVATTFKWIVISGVTVLLCGAVVYYIRTNSIMVENLRSTVQSLRNIVELLHEKVESQSTFIKAQQRAIVSLLQVMQSKIEIQDKKTQELVRKSIEKMQHLNDQTMKSVQQMSQKVQGERLEKKIGSLVLQGTPPVLKIGLPFIFSVLRWPLKLLNY